VNIIIIISSGTGENPYRRYSPRAEKAGFGEIPEPTVTVWMGEGIQLEYVQKHTLNNCVLPNPMISGFFCW